MNFSEMDVRKNLSRGRGRPTTNPRPILRNLREVTGSAASTNHSNSNNVKNDWNAPEKVTGSAPSTNCTTNDDKKDPNIAAMKFDSFDILADKLEALQNKGYNKEELTIFFLMAKSICKTKSDLAKITKIIYDFSVRDIKNATLGALVTAYVRPLEVENVNMGYIILTKLQADYEAFKKLRESNEIRDKQQLIANACFLTEVLMCVRLKSGKYLDFLVTPSIEYLDSLLEIDSEESIKIFCGQIRKIGKDLQSENPSDLTVLFKKVRQKIISSESTEVMRICLLDILELFLDDWPKSPEEGEMLANIFQMIPKDV